METPTPGTLLRDGISIENLKRSEILIIDDEEANTRLLERIFMDAGYEHLRSITDSREAMHYYQEIEPDLILLDLHMPFLSGLEVMKQIRHSFKPGVYLPIIVLTADVALETRRTALRAGAMDFLSKPFDAIEVTLRARNLLTTRFLYLRLQEHALLLAEKLCLSSQSLARHHGVIAADGKVKRSTDSVVD